MTSVNAELFHREYDKMNDEANDNEDFSDHNEGHTDDVFECKKCGHIGPAVGPIVTDWVPRPFGSGSVPMYTLGDPVHCEDCGSTDVHEYIRKPTKTELKHLQATHGNMSKADQEEHLTELDPDWRERFGGDVERAMEFYK
jgi:hypothetical protein